MLLREQNVGRMADELNIYCLGDTHIGSRCFARGPLLKTVERIAQDPKGLWVHMGDEMEAIRVDDRRFNKDAMDEDLALPFQQASDVVDIFRPISEKCLTFLYGNHPYALRTFGNITRDYVCKHLGVPYGSYTCKLSLMAGTGKRRYQIAKLFLWHGPSGGGLNSNAKDWQQRQGNLAAGLRRHLEDKACDCLVMAMGHTHKLIVVPPAPRLNVASTKTDFYQSYLQPGDGSETYIEPDRRWYVNTGSFFKMYVPGVDSYAEMHGYNPVELGYAVIRIRDGKVASVDKVVV